MSHFGKLVRILDKGQEFGRPSLISKEKSRRSASCITLTNTALIVIKKEFYIRYLLLLKDLT
jgi:hypothetical protein